MSQPPLSNESFSRRGGVVAWFLMALPFTSLGGGAALAPIGAVAGVLTAPWSLLRQAVASGSLALALVAAFVVWAMASAAWSPAPGAWLTALMFGLTVFGLGLFILAAGVGRARDRELVRRAAVAGLTALMAVAAVEALFDYPVARQLAPLEGALAPEPDSARAGPPEPNAVAAEPGPLTTIDPAVTGAPDAVAETVPAKTRHGDAAFFQPDGARMAAIAIVCVWGTAAMLAPFSWPGWIGMAGLFLGAGWLCLQFNMPANAAALAAGLAAAGAALRWPRAGVSVTAQAAAAGLVVAPLAMAPAGAFLADVVKAFTGQEAPLVWYARLETWAYAVGRMREHLFWGYGMDASSTFDAVYNMNGFTLAYIPGHPHNAAIQIWLETGFIGAVLAVAALAAFGRRAGAALAEDRWAAAAAAGAVMSAAVISLLTMAAWSGWWWATLAAGAALVRASRRTT